MTTPQLQPMALIQKSFEIVPLIYVPLLILCLPGLALSLLATFIPGLSAPLLLISSLLVSPITSAGMIWITNGHFERQPISPQVSINQVIGRAVPLILGSLLFFVIIMAGSLLLIIPGIYLGVRLGFMFYSMVLEELDPVAALKSSWDLVKGHWWTVFLPSLLLVLMLLIPLVIIGLLLLATPIGGLVTTVLSTAWIPVFVVLYTLLYRTLKQQQGMSPEAPPL